MEIEKIEKEKFERAFMVIEENIDYILENEKKIVMLLDKLESDNEELRKQQFFIVQALKKLKEQIDLK